MVWQLTRACEATLDEYEGAASDTYVKVEHEVGGSPALVYLATEPAPGFARSTYLERVVAAAAARGLEAAYVTELASWAGAVTPALVRHVLGGYRLPLDGIDGSRHWLRVLENGRTLAAATPGADPALVELFALLHDSRRLDEDGDRGHGERAAASVQDLAAQGLLDLGSARVALLAAACARHEMGEVVGRPDHRLLLDADRLELARLGRRPDARLLSTAAAPSIPASRPRPGSAERPMRCAPISPRHGPSMPPAVPARRIARRSAFAPPVNIRWYESRTQPMPGRAGRVPPADLPVDRTNEAVGLKAYLDGVAAQVKSVPAAGSGASC